MQHSAIRCGDILFPSGRLLAVPLLRWTHIWRSQRLWDVRGIAGCKKWKGLADWWRLFWIASVFAQLPPEATLLTLSCFHPLQNKNTSMPTAGPHKSLSVEQLPHMQKARQRYNRNVSTQFSVIQPSPPPTRTSAGTLSRWEWSWSGQTRNNNYSATTITAPYIWILAWNSDRTSRFRYS